MRKKGLRQKDLAELFGVSVSLISFYFSGLRSPGVKTVLRTSKLTGIPSEVNLQLFWKGCFYF